MNYYLSIFLFVTALLFSRSHGFAPHVSFAKRASAPRRSSHQLSLSASALPDVKKMKASELRKELQSYGISTKSFFEKSELMEAVNQARAEGKQPLSDRQPEEGPSGGGSSTSKSREDRIAEEVENCKRMTVGELKKELQSYGIDTKSFFEKSEFVVAVAEARVDGKKKQKATSSGSRVEEYDPTYRDVVMQKMNVSPKSLLGTERIIDIQLGR